MFNWLLQDNIYSLHVFKNSLEERSIQGPSTIKKVLIENKWSLSCGDASKPHEENQKPHQVGNVEEEETPIESMPHHHQENRNYAKTVKMVFPLRSQERHWDHL